MIEVNQLRCGNTVSNGRKPISIDLEFFELLNDGSNDISEFPFIQLTKEWAHYLGFEVIDMGDFWEFNKGDFQLIQFKTPINNGTLEPVFVIHSKTSKHIKVPYVHKLQNLYFEIEGMELIYKPK